MPTMKMTIIIVSVACTLCWLALAWCTTTALALLL
jgi:hypothetical protein